MYRPLPLILTVGLICGSTASAMPVAPLPSTQASLTIPVGSGCGLGVRRGTFYDCPPYRAYSGHYEYDPYDRGYSRGYYRGYRRGYDRGYATGRYNTYPYGGYYGGPVELVEYCQLGSYVSCRYGRCWRVCY